MQTARQFLLYLAHFFLEWEMFQINFVEKIKTHILCLVTIKKHYGNLKYRMNWFSSKSSSK
jgi:hypothetical protein